MRLDVFLSERGMAKSRSYAVQLIKEGLVTVDGTVVFKASHDVENQEVKVTGELFSFVGRGGVKLDGAISKFCIDVTGLVCVDVGASTGGFTDCLLKHGAAKVFAVDSGHGQLDKALIMDKRIVNIEGFNARNLSLDVIGEACDMAVCDLSFISQTYVIKPITEILKDGGLFLTLIKPQFECGREAIGKGGIVKDKRYHSFAIRRVIECSELCGLRCIGIAESSILGGDGNREFTALFQKSNEKSTITDEMINEAVR